MSRHDIILTKNHQLNGTKDTTTNTFVYNTHGARFNADWLVRNIVANDGLFVIQDTNSQLSEAAGRVLDRKNYYTVNIDCANPVQTIKLNPFSLVHNSADIHFLFTNILFSLWDNDDPDIKAMSYLIDAFASTVFYMYNTKKAKQTLRMVVNMTKAITSYCIINDKEIPMYEALFTDNPNPDWVPKKYFMQFVAAAGDRKEEIAMKVYKFFKSIPESILLVTDTTDESLSASLFFKTAFIINCTTDDEKAVSKIILTLLITLLENTDSAPKTLVVMSQLDSEHLIPGLPRWLQYSQKDNIDYIIFSDSLKEFENSELKAQYIQNIKQRIDTTMLVHKNAEATKAEQELSAEDLQMYHSTEYVATINIPSKELRVDDEVF